MNNVLIYTENFDGKFKKSVYEIASYGSEIARKLGGQVIAISLGDVAEDELKSLGTYGISKVLKVSGEAFNTLQNQAYATVIAQAAKQENAGVIIFSASNTAKAIAPRVSVKLKAGMVFAATGLPSNLAPFTIPKKVFHGKAFADVVVNSECKIISLSQNSFGVKEHPAEVTIEAMQAEAPATSKIRVTDTQKASGKILLNDAEIIVSGGRGMKSAENWQPIEELAEILGAATACSRPISDEGWRPHSEHVGQTGKIVAPNLYFALGISGAIQHLAGVSSSKVIVAINTDKDAPIFQAADYGIVGDVQKVLPQLNDAFRKFKAEN
ncbi:MAG TPA: electron transfer flavoprotein subunit alpha/FixB family protein [Bacteroidales bacterium]|nr:electron transfer flavoprotein subunit alpha/FixB family protein [Bacteroidales bacterium]